MSTTDDIPTGDSIRNVLFLHPSAEYRGADRTLLELVAAVDRSRWQPVVILPRRGPVIGDLQQLGAQIEVGPLGVVGEGFAAFRTLKFILQLPLCLFFVWRMIFRYSPALVHTHTAAVIGGGIAASIVAKRHLWHVHRVLDDGKWRTKRLARTIARLADTVVCSSDAAREALVHLAPRASDKASVIRNAVDTNRLEAAPRDRAELRESLGLDDESTLVVMVGRLAPDRGHHTVLRAAKRMRRDHPDTHFLLVGEPVATGRAYAESIDQAIEELGLQGVVRRLPYQRRIGAMYAAADIVCIASETCDPFRMVALEAMACGKPIVSSITAGTEEFILSGQTGLTFEPGDEERLAWALGVLVPDPGKRHMMGAAGIELQRTRFQVGRFRNEFDRDWSKTIKRSFVLPAQRASVVHIALGKANPERMNGVNAVVHNLAAAQRAAGIDVEVWGITKDVAAMTTARPYPLRLFKSSLNRFVCPRDMRAAILELDSTAVVHIHGGFVTQFASIAARLRRRSVPYVVTPHGAYRTVALEKNRFVKALWLRLREQKMLRSARSIQALSGRELLEMERLVNIESVQVIPNGQSPVTVYQGQAPPDVAAADKSPIFAFCGRLVAHTKGLDALLEGFARYVVSRGKGSLWIVGDGVDREMLENLAESLSIQRRVTFFGALFGNDKALRLSAADAFIHPSRHEGMPTAVLEAGALGLPLLITPGTNLDNEVRGASAGYIIPDVTPEAIAETLFNAEVEHFNGQMAHRSRNAAWLVASTFSWDRIAALTGRDLYGLQGLADPDAPVAPHHYESMADDPAAHRESA